MKYSNLSLGSIFANNLLVRVSFLGIYLLLGTVHVSAKETSIVSGDSAYTLITQPTEGATFTGPTDITVEAEVHGSAEVNYFEIGTPDDDWRVFKLGYDPNNVNSPKRDVTASNTNTHLEITLKALTANTEWDKIGVLFDNNLLMLDDYTPTGGYVLNTWVTISIPLTDFVGDDFTDIANIRFPRSIGANAFTLGVKEVKFTGGTSDFIWFGGTKIDNSHTGTPGTGTPSSGTFNANLLQESAPTGTVTRMKFYANGQLIGIDSVAPYSATLSNVLYGSFALTTVTEMSDTTAHAGGPVNIVVNADSTSEDVDITSLADSTTLIGPVTFPLNVDVFDLGESYYFEVSNPGGGDRKLKIGYDPQSIYAEQDVTAGGTNTHLEISLKTMTAGIDWSKVDIKFDNTKLTLSNYLPSGGVPVDTWVTFSFPMADFGDDFTEVEHLKFPFTDDAAAFTMGIQKIEFTGGTQDFLWFGETKIDNSHDGSIHGETPESDELNVDLMEGGVLESVSYYMNGSLVATDSVPPFNYIPPPLTQGTYQFSVVASYGDGSTRISEPVVVMVDSAEEEQQLVISGDSLFAGNGQYDDQLGHRSDLQIAIDSTSGNIVLVWLERRVWIGEDDPVPPTGLDVYFAIIDSAYQLITLPTGYTSWPIRVNIDEINALTNQYNPEVSINQSNGNIAIGWTQYANNESQGQSSGWEAAFRVFSSNGNALTQYVNKDNSFGPISYNNSFNIDFGLNNELYYAIPSFGGYKINKVNVTSGLKVLADDSLSTDIGLVKLMTWDEQLGLILASDVFYVTISETEGITYSFKHKIQFWNSDLASKSTVFEQDDYLEVLEASNGNVVSISNPRVLVNTKYSTTQEVNIFTLENDTLKYLIDSILVSGGDSFSDDFSARAIFLAEEGFLGMTSSFINNVNSNGLYSKNYYSTFGFYNDTLIGDTISFDLGRLKFMERHPDGRGSWSKMVYNSSNDDIILGTWGTLASELVGSPSDIYLFPITTKQTASYAILDWQQNPNLYPTAGNLMYVQYPSRKLPEDVSFQFYDDAAKSWNPIPVVNKSTAVGPNKFILDVTDLDNGQTYLVSVVNVEGEQEYFRILKRAKLVDAVE